MHQYEGRRCGECHLIRCRARRADPVYAAREHAQQVEYRKAVASDPFRKSDKNRKAAEYRRNRCAVDPEWRERLMRHTINSFKKRSAADPNVREKARALQTAWHRKKSATDPQYSERQREATAARRANPSYAAKEREAAKASDRRRNADPEFRAAKLLYMKERFQRPEVRERKRSNDHKRRARLIDSSSPGVTPAEWLAVCAEYTDATGIVRCAYCGSDRQITVDHVVPIARGGKDSADNVVPACKTCNCSKRDRLLSEWHRAPKNFRRAG